MAKPNTNKRILTNAVGNDESRLTPLSSAGPGVTPLNLVL